MVMHNRNYGLNNSSPKLGEVVRSTGGVCCTAEVPRRGGGVCCTAEVCFTHAPAAEPHPL